MQTHARYISRKITGSKAGNIPGSAADEPTQGTSQVSYLSFPCSLLELEAVLLRHPNGHAKAFISALRSEERGAMKDL